MMIRRPPELDAEFTLQALVLALRQTLEDAGRTGLVVGLSGGVDSALAAALAVRAVGSDGVSAMFLPGPATSSESETVAGEVSTGLGISLETISLAPILEQTSLAGDALGAGNFTTRLRMALVYDRAANSDALVIGTSNKSEIVLGYTTLWGDMAADIWPLGDVYKTQVWDLARAAGLPEVVVQRAPSAELWEGQTDEEELGFPYSDIDRVLYYYLEERMRPDEIVTEGESAELVDHVLERVRGQSYKRSLPHVPKLTVRTVGHDFLHPRAWTGPA